MSQQDRIDKDGVRHDDVSYDSAASHLFVYEDDREELAPFQEPVLLHSNNPHERLYIAALDGTGNDKFHDPGHETNVGLISDQIEALKLTGNSKVGGDYVEGPGTQQHAPFTRLLDGMYGHTVDERAEQMYKLFIEQAWKWKQLDPDAQIRVASIGFSRGGEEVALFARMVEERGIQNPSGAQYTYDSHHQIKYVEYTKPALVGPHQVAQAVAMFDPVGTGSAMREDRRLPPSVVSGIQFTAMDEHRGLFKSDRIIDPGITADGRFAGVYVPGAHSDVGGGYNRNGLAIRSGNFAIDYINGLSDVPILAKTAEPDDPRLNVIHHSQDGMFLYRVAPKIDRLAPDGYNELEVSRHAKGQVPDAYNAEPRNEALSTQFERQPMPNGPVPGAPELRHEASKSELDQWIDRMYTASQNPDNASWDKMQHETAQTYLRTPDGLQFQQQADHLNGLWDLQWQAQQRDQASQQMVQPAQQGFSR
jgi:type VI secretion system (T6SS) phospholipase Tle1-like effector